MDSTSSWIVKVGRNLFWFAVALMGVALYISAPEAATALVDSVLIKAASWVQF